MSCRPRRGRRPEGQRLYAPPRVSTVARDRHDEDTSEIITRKKSQPLPT